MVARLLAADIRKLVEESFAKAVLNGKRMPNKARSREFVKVLAEQFRKQYQNEPNIKVFSRDWAENRREFGLNELLYDITVCKTGKVNAAKRDIELSYIKEGICQVESEFSKSSKQGLYDFNKLVLGSAPNKIFIGPRLNNDIVQQAFLDVFKSAAQACSGNIFIAMVPHPKVWADTDLGVQVYRFNSDSNRWAMI